MKLRSQPGRTLAHGDYLTSGPLADADRTTTVLTEEEFVTGRFTDLPFVLGLRLLAADESDGVSGLFQRPSDAAKSQVTAA
ncbi:hypothetical protein [Streptomyces sp. NPDC001450]